MLMDVPVVAPEMVNVPRCMKQPVMLRYWVPLPSWMTRSTSLALMFGIVTLVKFWRYNVLNVVTLNVGDGIVYCGQKDDEDVMLLVPLAH